ncbi:MAG TPA: GMC family oxidoreductase [Devosiaceae bacterium]
MAGSPDIVIIGSGIGGATLAAGLAPGGADILVLERGDDLPDTPELRDQRAIFQKGHYRPEETWYDAEGNGFNPGNYYYVGGNSKFYGAVLTRYRKTDFEETRQGEGVSPAWPFPYSELEPWYTRAEALYQVRGTLGEDPTEPDHGEDYPFPAIPDEPAIAEIRQRLKAQGLSPYSLPLGVDIERWLKRAKTPWDAHPNRDDGKMEAESCGLAAALAHPNVRIEKRARVVRLETGADGRRITSVVYERDGEIRSVTPRLVVLSAGAVQSAVLLLASANDRNPNGLANRSDQVGRNFMNHNSSAMLAISPFYRNDAIYQKTFGLNDFYLDDGEGGPALGNVQLLGRVSGRILKANVPSLPEAALEIISRHAIDFYLMTEDLPSPKSRVRVENDRIVLEWHRTNWEAHRTLVSKMRHILRAAGFPLVLVRAFDKRTPSHQCGTVRMGADPASAPLDPFCRAYDHPNLFVVDASFLPTSAAVNPALTIAAQALRVADHIAREEFKP